MMYGVVGLQCTITWHYGHTRKSGFWKLLNKATGTGDGTANKCTVFRYFSLVA